MKSETTPPWEQPKSKVYETARKPFPEGMPEDWPKEASVKVFSLGPDKFEVLVDADFADVGEYPDLQTATTLEEAQEIADTMLANMDKWPTQEYPYSE